MPHPRCVKERRLKVISDKMTSVPERLTLVKWPKRSLVLRIVGSLCAEAYATMADTHNLQRRVVGDEYDHVKILVS